MRSRFVLIYETRSAQGPLKAIHGAGLENPRIVMANSDASVIIGVAGSGSAIRRNSIEIIHTDPSSNKINFTNIDLNGKTTNIERNPKLCASCHAGIDTDQWKKTLRPLWDGYPNWFGVFGSAHNDLSLGRGRFGTSTIKDFEFEQVALDRPKASSRRHPRLSALIDLNKVTLRNLSASATQMTEVLIRRQIANVANQVTDALLRLYIDSRPGFYEVVKFLDQFRHGDSRYGTPLEKWLTPSEFEKIKNDILKNRKKYAERLYYENIKILEKYGTPKDKKLISELTKSAEEVNWGFPRASRWASRPLEMNFEQFVSFKLGIDPFSLSTLREYGEGYSLGIGVRPPLSTFMEYLEPFLSSPDRAVAENRRTVCKVAFMPTYQEDIDQGRNC